MWGDVNRPDDLMIDVAIRPPHDHGGESPTTECARPRRLPTRSATRSRHAQRADTTARSSPGGTPSPIYNDLPLHRFLGRGLMTARRRLLFAGAFWAVFMETWYLTLVAWRVTAFFKHVGCFVDIRRQTVNIVMCRSFISTTTLPQRLELNGRRWR